MIRHEIRTFLVVLLGGVILIVQLAFSSLFPITVIKNSGRIISISPLHAEGRWIKDRFNNTILLKGVWIGSYADTSTGNWGGSYWKWNEEAMNYTFNILRSKWGINVINTFILGDWWLENKATTIVGGTTDIGLRDAIIRTVQVAAEYGIYVQIRLYACTQAEGRREGFPFQPTYKWSVQDFINFWVNVSYALKDYPNVLYCLFDEPTAPEGYDMYDYFDVANQTINAIRQAGSNQLIVIHWGYCSHNCAWMLNWVNGGYTTDNIVFSTHIYRYHGTFDNNPDAPVYINYIKAELDETTGGIYGINYTSVVYNIPIWVSAIGAHRGYLDDEEYIYFWNTLTVLNEFNLGYAAFFCGYGGRWSLLQSPQPGEIFPQPNRVGQALINAIAGIPAPPTYTLTVNSVPVSVQATINDTSISTNYTSIKFAGTYQITVPSTVVSYTHHVLFGTTQIENINGYYTTVYSSGPYMLNSPATISSIYFYAGTSGKVKIAIYNSSISTPKVPTTLIVASSETNCPSAGWVLINMPSTYLSAGEYFFAVKIDRNGMLAEAGGEQPFSGAFMFDDYSNDFPESFNVDGYTATPYFAAYIPTSPYETTTYYFLRWNDGEEQVSKIISLQADTALTAIYG